MREPDERSSSSSERADLATQTIAEVRVDGVSADLADTLHALLKTRSGQRIDEAPLRADLRTLWALGVVDDARVELDGDRVVFVVAPRPLIRRVVVPHRDPITLGRFDLLAGTRYEPRRIARIAAGAEVNYRRDGYLDARVAVQRAQRGSAIDVCVAATPGPKVTIGTLSFPGRTKLPEATLIAQLHGERSGLNRPGGIFDADALDIDRHYMMNEYYEAGMISTWVGPIRSHRRGARIDVEIPITEGPVFSLGTVAIANGRPVKVDLVPGELFKRSRVQAAREAIEAATGMDALPLSNIDPAHMRVDITFELSWRWPWDALRLWLWQLH